MLSLRQDRRYHSTLQCSVSQLEQETTMYCSVSLLGPEISQHTIVQCFLKWCLSAGTGNTMQCSVTLLGPEILSLCQDRRYHSTLQYSDSGTGDGVSLLEPEIRCNIESLCWSQRYDVVQCLSSGARDTMYIVSLCWNRRHHSTLPHDERSSVSLREPETPQHTVTQCLSARIGEHNSVSPAGTVDTTAHYYHTISVVVSLCWNRRQCLSTGTEILRTAHYHTAAQQCLSRWNRRHHSILLPHDKHSSVSLLEPEIVSLCWNRRYHVQHTITRQRSSVSPAGTGDTTYSTLSHDSVVVSLLLEPETHTALQRSVQYIYIVQSPSLGLSRASGTRGRQSLLSSELRTNIMLRALSQHQLFFLTLFGGLYFLPLTLPVAI